MTESHSICIPCWNRFNADTDSTYQLSEEERRKWVRLPAEDTCCFCLVQHRSGIYVRAHISETVCRGHSEAVLTALKSIVKNEVTKEDAKRAIERLGMVTPKEPVTASYDPSEYYLPTVEEVPYEGLTHEQLVEEELGLALGLTHVIGSDPDDEENLDSALEDMI